MLTGWLLGENSEEGDSRAGIRQQLHWQTNNSTHRSRPQTGCTTYYWHWPHNRHSACRRVRSCQQEFVFTSLLTGWSCDAADAEVTGCRSWWCHSAISHLTLCVIDNFQLFYCFWSNDEERLICLCVQYIHTRSADHKRVRKFKTESVRVAWSVFTLSLCVTGLIRWSSAAAAAVVSKQQNTSWLIIFHILLI